MIPGTTVRIVGGLFPSQLVERIASGDSAVPGTAPADYHFDTVTELNQGINRAWTALSGRWAAYKAARALLPEGDRATPLTRERWLLPLFQELGYGRLQPERTALEADGRAFALSHRWGRVPIHLVGAGISLDKRIPGERGAAASAPHALVQDFLNHDDNHLWAFVSNGLELRILRDHHSLTQQAYVTFDLETLFDGEQFSAFRLLFLLCHVSRVEGDDPRKCRLEQWVTLAREDGVRALDRLRAGVEVALAKLGSGFVAHRANEALRARLASGQLSTQEFYRQLLRLVYRLLFLFVAEDRDLLLVPDAPDAAKDRYRRLYATRRLRTLALRRRGSPHDDAWQCLRLVMRHLDRGCPDLALPALGSFLWGTEAREGQRVSRALPDLDGTGLDNEHLYAALAALCAVQDGPIRRPVDWAGVQSDELGSVYESLMEKVPRVNAVAGTFELADAAGNERKTTGSYYTPTSLVDCLLDSALDPVLEEAARNPDPERALLELAVVDPACGSGHFLVAAARRIARRLARVRCGGIEPSPPEVQHALRDVVGRCIYGVDLNPMAVELCKVSLWMEAMEPGRPLSFLDAHVRHGNALLGTTAALMAKGIPDAAWDPIEGDDKKVASALKKRNKKHAVEEQLAWSFVSSSGRSEAQSVALAVAALEAEPDANAEGVARKESQWDGLLGSPAYRREKFVADAWCAAFAWLKESGALSDAAPTNDLWRQLRDGEGRTPELTTKTVEVLSEQYHYFHWELAFPTVFTRGGFDVVLGNPPWDTLSPDAKEFFSRFDDRVRFQSKAEQEATIATLCETPTIAEAWRDNRRSLFATASFLKESGRFTMFASGNLGKGDFNIYRMFVEVALTLSRPGGRAAQIVPDGLYAGANSMALRETLFTRSTWERLFGFENTREVWFPGVDSRAKFALYSAKRGGVTETLDAAFLIRSPEELRLALTGGTLKLPVAMVREFSPDALAVMEFRSQRDIDIARRMYARWPPLGKVVPGTAHRDFLRELESGHVQEYLTTDSSGLPHYEGRMVSQYDHRAKGYRSGRARAAVWEDLPFGRADKALQPQWYVPRDKVPAQARARIDQYRVAFCDVASPTNERTLVATVIPPGCIAGAKVPTILFRSERPLVDLIVWLAVANSFTMDLLARMKVSLTMAIGILDSLPFPRLATEDPRAESLATRVLRLVCTGPEMIPLWNEMAAYRWVERVPDGGAPPGATDDETRRSLVAEIEAIVAGDLFGLTASEINYVMDTFPIVRERELKAYGEYRTKNATLKIYHAMAEVARTGRADETRLDPPPAAPIVEHPPREGGKVLTFRPAARPQPAIQPSAVTPTPRPEIPTWSPELLPAVATKTGLPASAGRWGTTLTGVDLGIAALAAVLRNAGGPASRDEVERAVVLSVLPGLLQSKFDAQTAPKWRRAVGTANMNLSSIATLSIPWAEVLRRATVEHLLVVDGDGRWRAGSDIDDAPSDILDARALVALSWLDSVSGAGVDDADLVTQLGVLRAA